MQQKTLRNRTPVALVTGGGRRLGKQIALALASNGYDVVINYNKSKSGAERTAKTIKAMGRRALVCSADISKQAQVKRMVSRSLKEFGRIDVLVNNAGVFVDGSILTTTEALWERTLDINLKGTFLCTQAVVPHMLKQRFGNIINIASLGGIQAWSKHLPYNVSKAGIIMLTKCLAKELAPHVCVNAIAPGVIIISGEESESPSHINYKKIPLRKYGNAKDITDLLLFLVQKASYITGQIFSVDGGRSIQ